MKKKALLALPLCLLLCGCGAQSSGAEITPLPSQTPAPVEEEAPFAEIAGQRLDAGTEELTLEGTAGEIAALLENRALLSSLRSLHLTGELPDVESYRALREAFPDAALTVEPILFGEKLDSGAKSLDLSAMRPEQMDELLAVLPYLESLEEINFVSPEGVCAFGLADIPQLDRLREARPELYLKLRFELFGQTVSSEDQRIEYYRTHIGNDGAETVRAVLPYLRSCDYLLMDGCDVDNEVMAQLREDFPETKVVWRVWLCEPYYESRKITLWNSFLTDTDRIRTVKIRDNNSSVLKYCTETKYVDFGHNMVTSDFSFLGYMPKLEVCIIAITGVSDLSPLANCPELEYLEVYGSQVTDLSPIANCTKLKHLNCSRLYGLTDITPIYGLDLERFRCVATNVPKEQIAEYARLHPDCEMLMDGGEPHLWGWRYDEHGKMVPRYALLREQLRYDEDAANGIP